jgi:hypothetical protein
MKKYILLSIVPIFTLAQSYMAKALPYKKIIPSITSLGATKLQDENVTALRMAGLFPDEYMIKFVLDDVKLEFF